MVNNSQPTSAALGYVIECHGVQIRAQLRSVATVVQVTGPIRARNRDLVGAHVSRFARLETPLVLDLLGCRGFSGELLETLLQTIGNDCDGADLTFVIDPLLRDARMLGAGVEIVGSVAEALGIIAARVRRRRAAAFLPSGGRSLRAVEETGPEAAEVARSAKHGVHETNEAV